MYNKADLGAAVLAVDLQLTEGTGKVRYGTARLDIRPSARSEFATVDVCASERGTFPQYTCPIVTTRLLLHSTSSVCAECQLFQALKNRPASEWLAPFPTRTSYSTKATPTPAPAPFLKYTTRFPTTNLMKASGP